jgi:hypothetical protein
VRDDELTSSEVAEGEERARTVAASRIRIPCDSRAERAQEIARAAHANKIFNFIFYQYIHVLLVILFNDI